MTVTIDLEEVLFVWKHFQIVEGVPPQYAMMDCILLGVAALKDANPALTLDEAWDKASEIAHSSIDRCSPETLKQFLREIGPEVPESLKKAVMEEDE